MKHPTMSLLCILLATFSLASAGLCLELAKSGKTDYSIVVANDAIPAEVTAAKELKLYLDKVTGADFAIVGSEGAGTHCIYVGQSQTAKSLLPGVDFDALGTDGIVVKTVGDDLVIAGGRPRGTLYAVYTFLEDVVGCRWWTADDSFIPSKPTLEVGLLNTIYRPKFGYREVFTLGTQGHPLFTPKLRLNGNDFMPALGEEWGGQIGMGGGHSLLRVILPPNKYFDKHPEWYSFRKSENKRQPGQLCMTDEAMKAEALKNVLDGLKQSYPGRKYGPKVVQVSEEDNDAVCECDKCTALRDREGGESGPLIELVNYIADGVAKEYPDVLVSTLAYWWTQSPPKTVRPRDNVLVVFAPLDRNHAKSLDQVPDMSKFLTDWRQMTRNVWIWDYTPHFGNFITPHPNHYVMGQSLKYYEKLGVTGVFIQSDFCEVGEFSNMRNWVNAHMAWNPDLDDKALISEFLKGYYGKAAPEMQQYIDLLWRTINRRPNTWLGVYGEATDYWLTLDDMNAATQLFDKAANAAVGDPAIISRVRNARMGIDMVWLQRYRTLLRESQQRHTAFLGPKDPTKAVEAFIRTCSDFKLGAYREWADLGELARKLRPLFPRAGKAPTEVRGLKSADWVDVQDNMMTLTPGSGSVALVDDPVASDGKAVKLSATSRAEEARFDLPAGLDGRWHIYMSARCEMSAGQDGTSVMGVYAKPAAVEVARVYVDWTKLDSKKYNTIDLGVRDLQAGAQIWVQPRGAGSYGEVGPVFVDRLFLVRAR